MTEPLHPDVDAAAGDDIPTPFADPEPGAAGPEQELLEPAATEPLAPTIAGVTPGLGRGGRGRAAALGYVAAALLGAVLVGGSLVAFGGVGRATPSPSPTPAPAPNVANGPALGTTAAPVTIEIWADYQCPYCRLEAMVFGGSMERAYVLPGLARVVYRDFAFLGQESIDAAVAARCAGRQDPGAYWRYHDLLFASQQGENQGTFKRANLVTLAGIAALDPTSFTACLDDPAVATAVTAETAQGRALGVTSTPTLRITGPGGTRTLKGFNDSWSAIRDAVAAVAVAPTPSPPSGAAGSPAGSGAPSAAP